MWLLIRIGSTDFRFQRLEDGSAFAQAPLCPKHEQGVAELSRHHADMMGQQLLALLQSGQARGFEDRFGMDRFVHVFPQSCLRVRLFPFVSVRFRFFPRPVLWCPFRVPSCTATR